METEIDVRKKQLVINPNADLSWPSAWVGIYDKWVPPLHLWVGCDQTISVEHYKQQLKQPFVQW